MDTESVGSGNIMGREGGRKEGGREDPSMAFMVTSGQDPPPSPLHGIRLSVPGATLRNMWCDYPNLQSQASPTGLWRIHNV